MADDAEAMAQLDWLWSSQINRKIPDKKPEVETKPEMETTVAELSRQLDKDQMDCDQQNDAKSKPIQK